jgi:hypothetical protein
MYISTSINLLYLKGSSVGQKKVPIGIMDPYRRRPIGVRFVPPMVIVFTLFILILAVCGPGIIAVSRSDVP